MRLIEAADHKIMPWKNGFGVTREVALAPNDDEFAGFDWRLSIATISAPGAFSSFRGIDRTIAVLQGDRMVLRVDGVAHPLARGSLPFAFAGEAEVHVDDLSGEMTDLNIMTRRGRFRHDMRRIVFDGEHRFTSTSPVNFIVFNSSCGFRSAGFEGQAARLDTLTDFDEHQTIELSAEGPAEIFCVCVAEISETTKALDPLHRS